jgi:IS5 family transposase
LDSSSQIAGRSGRKQAVLGLDLSTRPTGEQVFLEEMNHVMPWRDLFALIAPHASVATTARPPFDLEMSLRIHCLQKWV